MQKQSGSNQASLKESNLSLIIRSIHSSPNYSRVSLANKTGLKQATITKIIGLLIEWGLVSETESMESGVGRRPIRLTLNSDRYLLIGARINRNYVRVGVYDISGKLYSQVEEETNADEGALCVMRRLKGLLRTAISEAPRTPLAIGMALPGPFDAGRGRITMMSGFPGWEEIDIEGQLKEAFHLPVFLDHDANCGALAELWYGGHENGENMLYVVCDRGVGAGFILGGEIYRGAQGFAGEIGHASINIFGPACECGNRGCLELYCSTKALENEYKQIAFDVLNPPEGGGELYVPADEIMRRVVRGDDPAALRAYEKVVSYLAFGTVSMINTLNPGAVIYSDKITAGGAAFLDIVSRTLRRYLMPHTLAHITVSTCAIEGDPMLLGASVLAFDRLLAQPSLTFGR